MVWSGPQFTCPVWRNGWVSAVARTAFKGRTDAGTINRQLCSIPDDLADWWRIHRCDSARSPSIVRIDADRNNRVSEIKSATARNLAALNIER